MRRNIRIDPSGSYQMDIVRATAEQRKLARTLAVKLVPLAGRSILEQSLTDVLRWIEKYVADAVFVTVEQRPPKSYEMHITETLKVDHDYISHERMKQVVNQAEDIDADIAELRRFVKGGTLYNRKHIDRISDRIAALDTVLVQFLPAIIAWNKGEIISPSEIEF